MFFLVFQKPSPQAVGLPDVEEYVGASDASTPPDPEGFSALRFVLRSRVIWTLGGTYVALKFIRYSFLFWLPFYMSRHLGYGEGEAGYTSIAFDVAGLCGVVFAGIVSDRLFGGRRAPIIVIMMTLLAVATYLFTHVSGLGRIENAVALAVIGFLLYGPDSVTSGVAAVDFGSRRAAAMAAGFINGLGSIGGALSGIVVGLVSDTWGWEAVFTLFSPLALGGALLMTTMWNRTPRSEGTPR